LKKIIIGWNWKHYSFILGLILLFVASVIGVFSGGESTATADSDACNKYFAGMALTNSDVTKSNNVYTDWFVVHAISKERGLLTIKKEMVYFDYAGSPYVYPKYVTVPCNNVRIWDDSDTNISLYPNVR
jgi:hypothetical protein